ncbi:hypothetical protein GE061_013367 [Apolygus lucorum]|uniref:PiggyBac transposable element-derived protein domain-containing protein n=1 Tax=Apolygus lucorum TaxID=248454 RepID=A0A6A4KEC8_APOLU|nr:hypothetical protein GE061_013367 [Apolygus lucorum]
MAPWRGRISFRQYLPLKKHKYGFKLNMLTEPDSLIHRFLIYAGAADPDVSGEGHASKVVYKLMTALLGEGRAIYMDNFYNSVELASSLLDQQTYVTGTLRPNRKNNPRDLAACKLKRGESTQRWSQQGINVTKWKDKREVWTISSEFSGDMVTVSARRGTAQKPSVVVEYNKRMGGIDQVDQNLSYYTAPHRSIKWYKKLGLHLIELIHMLDLTVSNAWLLYRRQNPQSSKTLKQFIKAVADSLAKMNRTPGYGSKFTPKRGRPPCSTDQKKKTPSKPLPCNADGYVVSPLLGEYALRATGIQGLTANTITTASSSYARAYAVMRIAVEFPSARGSKHTDTLVIGELTSLLINTDRILTEAAARRKLVKTVLGYLALPEAVLAANPPAAFNLELGQALVGQQWPSPFEQRVQFLTAVFPRAAPAVEDQAGAARADPRPAAQPQQPAAEPFEIPAVGDNDVYQLDSALLVLCWNIVRFLGAGHARTYPHYWEGVMVHAFLGITQTGTITFQKVNRLREDFKAELGVNVTIDRQTIAEVYNYYKNAVNETTIQIAIAEFDALLPDAALRWRLLMEQVRWHNLTNFSVIRTAMTRARTFPWSALFSMPEYLSEYNAFEAAYETIADRPYYGFNADLGLAKSTNFKRLGAVCAVICKQLLGDEHIDAAEGIARNFPNRAQIMRWIRDMNLVADDQSVELKTRVIGT